jgi:hypothetical protein
MHVKKCVDRYIIHACKSCPPTGHRGAWGERRYSSYPLLTSALDGGEWSASRQGKDLSTHWIGGWVGPRAGLDQILEEKILCLYRGTNPGRPVRSQSLY